MINRIENSELNESNELFGNDYFSGEIEKNLSKHVNDCLKSEKFSKIPVSIVYRIFEKSDYKKIDSDSLYDFIKASVEERCPLLHFIDLKKLSYTKIENLSQNDMSKYYCYLTRNFKYLIELTEKVNKLEEEKEELSNDKKQLEDIKNRQEKEIHELQLSVNELKEINQQQGIRMKQLEEEAHQTKKESKKKSREQKLISNSNFHPLENTAFTRMFSGDHFSGIFKVLSNWCKGNIHNKGLIEITGNETINFNLPIISTIVDFDSNQKCYYSQNVPNLFVCFDFKNNSVSVTAYSFKASNRIDPYYLRSWVLEGSNDGKNWIELDSHLNDTRFNSPSQVILFPIMNEEKQRMKFKFIKLKMTGKNDRNGNYLDVFNIELFGSYF